MQELKELVSEIPDFPKPGILFRDISPLLRERFDATIAAVEELFSEAEWQRVDAVAGIESRGFILASALAERRGKGFVPIRKKGKLPPPVVDVAYDLEYGTGVLEMQTRPRLPVADRRRARDGRHARRVGGAEPAGGLRALRGSACCSISAWRPASAATGTPPVPCCSTADPLMSDTVRRAPHAARRSCSFSSRSSSTCSRSGWSSRCCRT